MKKTNTTISIDQELHLEVRKKGINLSEEVNNYLKSRFQMDEDNPDETDLEARIVHAKARLMSLEGEKKKLTKQEEGRYHEVHF